MDIYIYTHPIPIADDADCISHFLAGRWLKRPRRKKIPGDDNQISTMELEATNHCSAIYGPRFTK